MGLGGSITPNVEQFATDAEPLGERDDVVIGIHSLEGVPTKFVAIPLSPFSSHFAAPFPQSVQLHAQQTATGVEHNPLSNLRRVDASRPGFQFRGTQNVDVLMHERRESEEQSKR